MVVIVCSVGSVCSLLLLKLLVVEVAVVISFFVLLFVFL